MIFSRKSGSGRHAKDDTRASGARRLEEELGLVDDEPEETGPAKADRPEGPYDVTEAPAGIPQLDLGALKVPAVDDVEVRVQADNEGKIQQIVLVHNDSALQLGVFAAPRSEGIWDEVRAEIRKQLFTDGVAAEDADGEWGVELRARVRTPDGLTDIRFVGIDGPRWLVRAVFQGPAAIDPEAAPPLLACLRNLVVDRGHEAMPVREPLPLHLPKEVAEATAADGSSEVPLSAAANGAAESGGTERRKPSPRPRRK